MQSWAGELCSTVLRRYHSSLRRYRFRIRRSVGVAPSKAGGHGSSRVKEHPRSTISRSALNDRGTDGALSRARYIPRARIVKDKPTADMQPLALQGQTPVYAARERLRVAAENLDVLRTSVIGRSSRVNRFSMRPSVSLKSRDPQHPCEHPVRREVLARDRCRMRARPRVVRLDAGHRGGGLVDAPERVHARAERQHVAESGVLLDHGPAGGEIA